ncbi:hypothetical protein [Corynebacterium riegelii]|uniref:Uncharacterized protein n=1 Tax=Corynebacterium riegelii TaxID=156976 RepID=A0A0K1RDQ4_9CORY|nr:hypothetical protein [Corynebacterium riegelii]AKV59565.1 hypothetical protein AK829_11050 [Corynebacterium riegelii]
MEEYTLYFTPLPVQGEDPAITQQEIIELAERIDADHVIYDQFEKRQARILQYAAEVAAVARDPQLTNEQRAVDLSMALRNLALATSLYEEDVDNALAKNGNQPAFSPAVCELFALLASLYITQALDAFLQHPSQVFPEASYMSGPDVVVYDLGRGFYFIIDDEGMFTVRASSEEGAFDERARLLSERGPQPSHPIKITDADDARLSIKYAMEDWEDETGNTWADDHPDFQAEFTGYLDSED